MFILCKINKKKAPNFFFLFDLKTFLNPSRSKVTWFFFSIDSRAPCLYLWALLKLWHNALITHINLILCLSEIWFLAFFLHLLIKIQNTTKWACSEKDSARKQNTGIRYRIQSTTKHANYILVHTAQRT